MLNKSNTDTEQWPRYYGPEPIYMLETQTVSSVVMLVELGSWFT